MQCHRKGPFWSEVSCSQAGAFFILLFLSWSEEQGGKPDSPQTLQGFTYVAFPFTVLSFLSSFEEQTESFLLVPQAFCSHLKLKHSPTVNCTVLELIYHVTFEYGTFKHWGYCGKNLPYTDIWGQNPLDKMCFEITQWAAQSNDVDNRLSKFDLLLLWALVQAHLLQIPFLIITSTIHTVSQSNLNYLNLTLKSWKVCTAFNYLSFHKYHLNHTYIFKVQ